MDLSALGFGPADSPFQGYQDGNVEMNNQQYGAWPDCMNVRAGLAFIITTKSFHH